MVGVGRVILGGVEVGSLGHGSVVELDSVAIHVVALELAVESDNRLVGDIVNHQHERACCT